MPARSNEFQRLLVLVQRTFAPLGALVEESAMVSAPGIGQLREIDVLVTNAKSGPYRLKIAFEAKDHKRQLNITDIEGIIGKYRTAGSLVVDKIFIVTRKGVSKNAKEKASLNGIGILTLREVEQSGIPGFRQKHSKIDLAIQPHATSVSIKLKDGSTVSGFPLRNATFVCKCHGNDKYSVKQLIDMSMSQARDTINERSNESIAKNGTSCLRFSCDVSWWRFKSGNSVSDVSTLNFHVHSSRLSGPVDVTEYELFGDDTDTCRVRVASGQIAGNAVEISHPVGSSGNLFYKIKPCKKE